MNKSLLNGLLVVFITFSLTFPLDQVTSQTNSSYEDLSDNFIENLTIQEETSIDEIQETVSQEDSLSSSRTFFPSLTYTSHAPIEISSNAAFSSVASIGDGSFGNPWIIEDYNITTTDPYNGIYIHGVTDNFVIRDCLINTNNQNGYSGIFIQDVADGTCKISNNTLVNNRVGIMLYDFNQLVLNNFLFDNYLGMEIYGSNLVVLNNIQHSRSHGMYLRYNPSVYNNTVEFSDGNGIYCYQFTGELTNNTVNSNFLGIKLELSSTSIINNNQLYNNGFVVTDAEDVNTYLAYTIFSNNTVNGLPVGLLKNQHYQTISTLYGQLILINCTFINVYEQNYSTVDIGISLAFCDNVVIYNSICSNNNLIGIYVRFSCNITVSTSIVEYGGDGIFVDNSVNVTIANNEVRYISSFDTYSIRLFSSDVCNIIGNTVENSDYGIWADSYSNYQITITGNYFTNIDEGAILIYDAFNSEINDNSISYALEGIVMFDGTNNLLDNNIISHCNTGFKIYNSFNFVASSNDISYSQTKGFRIGNSFDFLLTHNDVLNTNGSNPMDGLGVWIENSYDFTVSYTILSNELNSTGGLYIDTCDNFQLDNSMMNSFGTGVGITIISSTNITIYSNYCTAFETGISVTSAFNTFIGDNEIRNCSLNGIYLNGVLNSTVEMNTIINGNNEVNSGYGIYFTESHNSSINSNVIFEFNYGIVGIYTNDTLIEWNAVMDCKYFGIHLYLSYYNIIHHNTLIFNNLGFEQGYDYSLELTNTWYDAETLEGNWWSDWNETGTYSISGSGAIDLYPLGGFEDSDGDGMPNWWEDRMGLDSFEDDADEDLDEDGLTNYEEYLINTHANNPDTDGDGMPDGWEVQYTLDPLDPADASTSLDIDDLTNLEEYQYGTDPTNYDTDGDLFSDSEEIAAGTNPLDENDYPGVSEFVSNLLLTSVVLFVISGVFFTKKKRR